MYPGRPCVAARGQEAHLQSANFCISPASTKMTRLASASAKSVALVVAYALMFSRFPIFANQNIDVVHAASTLTTSVSVFLNRCLSVWSSPSLCLCLPVFPSVSSLSPSPPSSTGVPMCLCSLHSLPDARSKVSGFSTAGWGCGAGIQPPPRA